MTRAPRASHVPGRGASASPAQRPAEPVVAGREARDHAVLGARDVQRMAADPGHPARPVPADHRVLDAPLRVTRERGARLGARERARLGRLEDVDAPVLGARGRAAHVQPPAPVGRAHERGPLQRLGAEALLGQLQHGLVALAVGRAREHGRRAAARVLGHAHAVREPERAVVVARRARCPGPATRAGAGRRDGDRRRLGPGDGDLGRAGHARGRYPFRGAGSGRGSHLRAGRRGGRTARDR